jgi:hypothetical protein
MLINIPERQPDMEEKLRAQIAKDLESKPEDYRITRQRGMVVIHHAGCHAAFDSFMEWHDTSFKEVQDWVNKHASDFHTI